MCTLAAGRGDDPPRSGDGLRGCPQVHLDVVGSGGHQGGESVAVSLAQVGPGLGIDEQARPPFAIDPPHEVSVQGEGLRLPRVGVAAEPDPEVLDAGLSGDFREVAIQRP